VKIAATAHRLRSGGRPSGAGEANAFAAFVFVNIRRAFRPVGEASRSPAGCTMDGRPSPDVILHDAYAEA